MGMETTTRKRDWLTIQEAATWAGVEYRTMYRWILRDGLPTTRTSKVYLIHVDDMKSWMASKGSTINQNREVMYGRREDYN